MQFHDADVPLPEYTLITPEDAQSIVKFVNRHRDEARLVVCQCEGRVSRSARVAALPKWLNGGDTSFIRYYQPDRYAYRAVLEAAIAPTLRHEEE